MSDLNQTPFLQVKNVSNTYRFKPYGIFGRTERKPVLDNVSFAIGRQEIFGLVGESGCGKTTMGKAILGLIDYSGEILIDGVKQEPRRAGQARVQAVFQDPAESLNPFMRVGAILEEPLKIHRLGNALERAKQVEATLRLVGLDASYKRRRVSELSGGQKQRIAIGASVMLKPQLIIADEAISALDVSVGAQILNLFSQLHQKLGLSLLFISHNLTVVYYLCSRIAVMHQGRIVECNTADAIYDAPQHPYTRALLAAEAGRPVRGDTD